MKKTQYRAISHWFNWSDLDYPSSSVEARIDKLALDASKSGVNLVMVFGFHFRWDFIYCFDSVHKLLKYTVDAYHRYGIKVMDHHSAVLTHRPSDWNGRLDTSIRNHHHVPLTPSSEIIPFLQYDGTLLNSWRQKRVDKDEAAFISCYQAEHFCVNNPDFRHAYMSYVKRLFAETGIDGLMCDDVIYYGHWGVCGCTHCQNKFGSPLPPPSDAYFWGNYQNPLWRKWVNMRYHDAQDFLQLVRDTIGPDALLTSCCSSSTNKPLDAVGLDMDLMNPPLSMTMLEMCGEIAGGKIGLTARMPDILLHKAISDRRQIGCLGLGYAFYPDSAFLIWSLNKFFGADTWVSSLKGRLGISERAAEALPMEPETVREAYNFECRYPHLFNGETSKGIAIYYSSSSKAFNGDCEDDYCTGYANLVKNLFTHDASFVVVDKIPEIGRHKLLILADCGCLSSELRQSLTSYLEQGGQIIATGLLGSFDETGNGVSAPWLVNYTIPTVDRSSRKTDAFFEMWGHHPKREIAGVLEANPDWHEFKVGTGTLYWNPMRMHVAKNTEIVWEKIQALGNPEITIEKPDSLSYQIHRSEKSLIIHFMPSGMKVNYHESLKNQISNERVVESIDYPRLTGEVMVKGKYISGTLYSPDLTEPRKLKLTADAAAAPLTGLKRFFTIELLDTLG